MGSYLNPYFGDEMTVKRELELKYAVPVVVFIAGVIATTQMRDFSEAFLFLMASVGQFVAYVFVSRLRQRGSFFWHVIASLASNGMWYAVMHVLDISEAYWLLFIPYLAGIIAGRTMGVILAQFVEKKYRLEADATRNPKLAPGERLNYLKREPTFWALLLGLIAYSMYGLFVFSAEMFVSLCIVISLGLLQNFFYALTTRASQRGSNWYIATTGIMSGLIFYISVTYLLSKNMPAALAIPYILSTSLGSATGAFFSMIIEWTFKMRPDAHLETKRPEKSKREVLLRRVPYVVLLVAGGAWLILQESIFTAFGWSIMELKLPIVGLAFDTPRMLIMASAAILFFLDSALHVVASRAGNRNHVGYHVSALVPKGAVDFLKISYLSLNSHIPDIVPIAVVSGCLGSLFGKNISENTERWLKARMDIVDEEKPKLKTA